jgi:HAD superfamily hydrolase (TIGR01509 family)
MKKYILFDNDGVLVETEKWFYLANKRALAPLGIDLPKETYLKNMAKGISVWQYARELSVSNTDISRARDLRNQYYQDYLYTQELEIEGVLETLRVLSADYKMAIITTSKPADFQLIHQNRSILEHIDFYLTRQDYKQAKPHPEPYLRGLERFGATAKETVVIEDSERGLKSAVAAGIDCIVVASDFTKTHDFSAASEQVAGFRELPSAIKALSFQSVSS